MDIALQYSWLIFSWKSGVWLTFLFFHKEEGIFYPYLFLPSSFGYPEFPALQLKPKQTSGFLFYWLNCEITTFNFAWNVGGSLLFTKHVEYSSSVPLITLMWLRPDSSTTNSWQLRKKQYVPKRSTWLLFGKHSALLRDIALCSLCSPTAIWWWHHSETWGTSKA